MTTQLYAEIREDSKYSSQRYDQGTLIGKFLIEIDPTKGDYLIKGGIYVKNGSDYVPLTVDRQTRKTK